MRAVVRGFLAVVKVVGGLFGVGLTLGLCRRRAVRGFRSALKEMGLPPEAVRALGASYPRIDLVGWLGGGGASVGGPGV